MLRYFWLMWDSLLAGEALFTSWLHVKGRYRIKAARNVEKYPPVARGDVIEEKSLPFPVVY